jgi:hypothetical protein
MWSTTRQLHLPRKQEWEAQDKIRFRTFKWNRNIKYCISQLIITQIHLTIIIFSSLWVRDMAKSGNLVSQRSFSSIFNPCNTAAKVKIFMLHSQFHTNNNSRGSVTITASTKRKDNLHSPLVTHSLY